MNDETIRRIVRASGVTTGELVLVHFWGEDCDKPIANDFLTAVASCGATPVLLQQSRSLNRRLFAEVSEQAFDDRYFTYFSSFDAVLDVFTYRPIVLGAELPPWQMDQYRRYIRTLFGALTHAKRFTQLRIPTADNAEESGLEPSDYLARMEQAYDLDYGHLLVQCRETLSELQRDHLTLRTGRDCLLSFDLSGRTWHVDAGDGDWPCGEVYIAPNECATQGTIWFETLFWEDLGCFADVLLTIENGVAVRSNHGEINAHLATQPVESRVVCELGLGMNPNVTSLCGYTVLDEKMDGTFHIALGANHMFGGTNHAAIHTDLVGFGQLCP